jgi:hypothetical protein
MSSLKNHLFELLIALVMFVTLLLLGYWVVFSDPSHGDSHPISESPKSYQEITSPFSQVPALKIGLPTTAEIVEMINQESIHADYLGNGGDSGSPPTG